MTRRPNRPKRFVALVLLWDERRSVPVSREDMEWCCEVAEAFGLARPAALESARASAALASISAAARSLGKSKQSVRDCVLKVFRRARARARTFNAELEAGARL